MHAVSTLSARDAPPIDGGEVDRAKGVIKTPNATTAKRIVFMEVSSKKRQELFLATGTWP
jgi:hypothetical protein